MGLADVASQASSVFICEHLSSAHPSYLQTVGSINSHVISVCPCVRPWGERTTGQVYAVGMGQATSTTSTQVSHGPDFDHSLFTSRGTGQPLTRDLASLVKVCEIQTSEENSAGPPSEYSRPQGPALPEASEYAAVIGTSHAQ